MKHTDMVAIAFSGNKQFVFTSALVLVAFAATPVWSGGQSKPTNLRPSRA